MFKKIIIVVLFINIGLTSAFSQKKSTSIDTLKIEPYDPLRPAKASFYSAVVPGLGQVYNKQYWKLPLVYGAIGTSVYLYIDNNKKYNLYRDEYKNRLEGYKSDDAFINKLTDSQMIAIQKQYSRNKDLSALFALGFYVLNIIDANVSAALSQFNVNEDLTLKPNIEILDGIDKSNLGLKCVYTF